MLIQRSVNRSVSLRSIVMDQFGPLIPTETLAYHELKQDPAFIYVRQVNVPELIEKLIHFGKSTAKKQAPIDSLQELINRLIKNKVRIHFSEVHPEDASIRATYSNQKKPTISVYRKSIQQLQHFFQSENSQVDEQDLYLLHLLHEWFHHLEGGYVGRADHHFARYSCKKWGPKNIFSQKKPLFRAREVAAHAFTQEMLQLNWSPLLLDYLLQHHKLALSPSQIEERLGQLEIEYQQLQDEATSPK